MECSDDEAVAEILNSQELSAKYKTICLLLEIKIILLLQTATCERVFSLRTLIKTKQRCKMGNTLLDILLMIYSNGPELSGGKTPIIEILKEALLLFKAYRDRHPARSSAGVARRKRKQKRGDLLSELADLENAIFNDGIPEEEDEEGLERGTGGLVLPDAQHVSEEDLERREEQEAEAERIVLDAAGRFEVPVGFTLLALPEDMSNKEIKKSGKKTVDRYKIAHRLCSGWSIGTLIQQETSKKNKGLYSVKWPPKVDGMTLHTLPSNRYGVDKDWVLLEISK